MCRKLAAQGAKFTLIFPQSEVQRKERKTTTLLSAFLEVHMVSVVPWPRCFCLATARCSWLPEKEGNKHTMHALFPRLTNHTSQPAWNLERGKEFEALERDTPGRLNP